jgi:hypothetical protein
MSRINNVKLKLEDMGYKCQKLSPVMLKVHEIPSEIASRLSQSSELLGTFSWITNPEAGTYVLIDPQPFLAPKPLNLYVKGIEEESEAIIPIRNIVIITRFIDDISCITLQNGQNYYTAEPLMSLYHRINL